MADELVPDEVVDSSPIDGSGADLPPDMFPPVDHWSEADPNYEDIPTAEPEEGDEEEGVPEEDEEPYGGHEDADPLRPYWVRYELHGRNLDSGEGWEALATADFNGDFEVAVEHLTAGARWEFRLRLVDRDGRPSKWSDPLQVTLPTDFTPPPAPTAPIISNVHGYTTMTWDGELTGERPEDFSHIVAYVRQMHPEGDPDGEPGDPRRVGTLSGKGDFPLLQFLGGVLHEAHFTAVDTSGNESPWSDTVEFTPTPPVDAAAIEQELEEARQRLEQAEADFEEGNEQRRLEIEDLRDNVIPELEQTLAGGISEVNDNLLILDQEMSDLDEALTTGLEDAQQWRKVGAINPSSVRIGDYENLLPESYIWELNEGRMGAWSVEGGWAAWTGHGDFPVVIRYDGRDNPPTRLEYLRFVGAEGNGIRVKPGDEFSLTGTVDAPQAGVELSVRYSEDGDGPLPPFVHRQIVAEFNGWRQDFAHSWRVPDDRAIKRMQLEFRVQAGMDSVFSLGDLLYRRRVDGNLIVDGSIFANHLSTNSVAARHLQSYTIATRHLAVGNWDNLMPPEALREFALEGNDSPFRSADGAWTAVTHDAADGEYALRFTNTGSGVRRVQYIPPGGGIRVKPGDEFTMTFKAIDWSGGNVSVNARYSTGGSTDGSLPPFHSRQPYYRITGSGFQQHTVSWTVPDDDAITHMQPEFIAGVDASGSCSIGNILLRRRVDSSLVVDGSITSAKVNTQEFFSSSAVIDRLSVATARAMEITAERGFIGGALLEDNSVTVDKIVVTEELVGRFAQFLVVEADMLAANAIQAMHISAGALDGHTITGSTIQTSHSMSNGGVRIVSSGSTYRIQAFDENGQERFAVGTGNAFFRGRLHAGPSMSRGVAIDYGLKQITTGWTDIEQSPEILEEHYTPYVELVEEGETYLNTPMIYIGKEGGMNITPGRYNGTAPGSGQLRLWGHTRANKLISRHLEIPTSHADQPGGMFRDGPRTRLSGRTADQGSSTDMFVTTNTGPHEFESGRESRSGSTTWAAPPPLGVRRPIAQAHSNSGAFDAQRTFSVTTYSSTSSGFSWRITRISGTSGNNQAWIRTISAWT